MLFTLIGRYSTPYLALDGLSVTDLSHSEIGRRQVITITRAFVATPSLPGADSVPVPS